MKINDRIIELFKKEKAIFLYDSINELEYSYEDFYKKILSTCNNLKQICSEKEGKIVVISENSFELLLIYFVALLSGNILIPIDPQKGNEEIIDLIEIVKPDLIINEKKELDLGTIEINKIGFIDIIKSNKLPEYEQKFEIIEKADFSRDYLITFTSGTTGMPKGVIHSFKNLYMSSIAFGKKFGFNSSNVFYHNFPMTYMAGILNTIFLPFLHESKLVLGKRFDFSSAMSFWETPQKYQVNVFWFNPTMIALLNKMDRGDIGKKYHLNGKIIACVGTAPLRKNTQLQFEKKYQLKLNESYGLSELLFISTNIYAMSSNGVGEILENVEIKILEDGEIGVKLPWKMKKYLNVKTSEYYYEEFYRTGDIGQLTDDTLTITGRKKDLIIRGGINISPKKLEDFLESKNLIEHSVVLGTEDLVMGEKIVCSYLISEKNLTKEMEFRINNEIFYELGKEYKIDLFKGYKEFPLNINGKIDRKTLKLEVEEKNDSKA